MPRVLLYLFASPRIRAAIVAYFDEEKLVIEGYDIGAAVDALLGDSDYEYSLTIHP